MEMGLKMKVRVRTDSSSAKGVVKRSGSGKMKHMAAKHLRIQEVVRQGIVDVSTIDTLHTTRRTWAPSTTPRAGCWSCCR